MHPSLRLASLVVTFARRSADAGTRAVGAQSAMAVSWKKMGFSGSAGGKENSNSDSLFVGTVLIQVRAAGRR